MHEMSLAESVVQIIEDYARREGFARVKTVWLEIGSLSGVETEAMRFCFDAASRSSPAEGARLEIVELPGTAWCMKCSESVALGSRQEPCPRCGSYQLQVTGGTEMRVKELEVD
jgi:hydrogenase nickel incorporation protein HypA/HybF